MPVKPLPHELVKRLERVGKKIAKVHHLLVNVDHRSRHYGMRGPRDNMLHHNMVRELNVSKTFPGIGKTVVIKRIHGKNAEDVVSGVENAVFWHNIGYPESELYDLLKPFAYPIDKEYIAMAKTDYPSVIEILYNPTKRGRKYFAELKKQGAKIRDLKKAAEIVKRRIGIPERNLLLVGFENGVFQFVPLVDLV